MLNKYFLYANSVFLTYFDRINNIVLIANFRLLLSSSGFYSIFGNIQHCGPDRDLIIMYKEALSMWLDICKYSSDSNFFTILNYFLKIVKKPDDLRLQWVKGVVDEI